MNWKTNKIKQVSDIVKINILCTLSITLIVFASCQSPKGYKIDVAETDAQDGKIYLMREIDKKRVAIDSVILENGKGTFKGNMEQPDVYYLYFENSSSGFPFFIENQKIKITFKKDSIDKATVTGSETHNLYAAFQKKQTKLKDEQTVLYNKYTEIESTATTEELREIENQIMELENKETELLKQSVEENINSVVSLYIIRNGLIYTLNFAKLTEYLNKTPLQLQSTPLYNTLKTHAQILEKRQPGQKLTDFSLATPAGTSISASSFQSKYLLIDFWASWCRPCRQTNPMLVEIYNKYNALGFEILGVSLDNNRDKWIEAIAADKLTWQHISDLKGWQNEVSQLYGVISIPNCILVDNNGIIIADNPSPEEIISILDGIFNTK